MDTIKSNQLISAFKQLFDALHTKKYAQKLEAVRYIILTFKMDDCEEILRMFYHYVENRGCHYIGCSPPPITPVGQAFYLFHYNYDIPYVKNEIRISTQKAIMQYTYDRIEAILSKELKKRNTFKRAVAYIEKHILPYKQHINMRRILQDYDNHTSIHVSHIFLTPVHNIERGGMYVNA